MPKFSEMQGGTICLLNEYVFQLFVCLSFRGPFPVSVYTGDACL